MRNSTTLIFQLFHNYGNNLKFLELLNKSILGMDTVWKMEDNIIRKKQGNIRQGRNLFHAKKIHAYLKLSMLYNWGLIG